MGVAHTSGGSIEVVNRAAIVQSLPSKEDGEGPAQAHKDGQEVEYPSPAEICSDLSSNYCRELSKAGLGQDIVSHASSSLVHMIKVANDSVSDAFKHSNTKALEDSGTN